jgi:hypothetical protein
MTEPTRTGRARARSGVAVLATAALAALGLLAAGCGGDATPQVAQIGTTTTTASNGTSSTSDDKGSTKGNPTAYSACMRKHGVRDFPDPDSNGGIRITGGVRNGKAFGIDPNSATFRKAAQACQKLSPRFGKLSPQQRQEEQQQMLRFAACMRSHGVPKFPDPQFSSNGGVRIAFGKGTGINPSSPQFQAAQKACRKLVPGSPLTAGPGPKQ